MITVIVPSEDDKDYPGYPYCTQCFRCEFPMVENKCGKFGDKVGGDNDTGRIQAETKPSV